MSTTKDIQDALDYHNKARADVGVAPLTLSDDLTTVAQEWADYLAKTGNIGHRPGGKYGENVAFDSSALEGAQAWYSEIRYYRKGSRFKGAAGHYTQMVWRDSTEVGIGTAMIKKGRFKGIMAIVANYNPPGNYMGQKPY